MPLVDGSGNEGKSGGSCNGSRVQGEYILFSHPTCTHWIVIQSVVLSLDDESSTQSNPMFGSHVHRGGRQSMSYRDVAQGPQRQS